MLIMMKMMMLMKNVHIDSPYNDDDTDCDNCHFYTSFKMFTSPEIKAISSINARST